MSFRLTPAAVAAGILLSCLAIIKDDIINPDGYLYLTAAERFLEGNISAGVATYPWPFYSVLIACVSWLTHLQPEYSAYLINTTFFSILLVAFLYSIEALGGRNEEALSGAILFLAHTGFNETYRTYIIRDVGYWALYMTAFYFFLQFWKGKRIRDAVLWGLACAFSALFRIEGVVMCLVVPMILFVRPGSGWGEKAGLYARAMSVPIAISLTMLVAGVIFAEQGHLPTGRLPQLVEYFREAVLGMGGILQSKASVFREGLFGGMEAYGYSKDYIYPGLVAILFVIFLVELVGSMTVPYFVLLGYAMLQKPWNRIQGFGVLAWFALLNAGVLYVFLVKQFFLTGRYPIPLVLLLMIPCAFALADFYRRWTHGAFGSARLKWAGYLMAAVIILMFGDVFVGSGTSKEYIKDAGRWMGERLGDESQVAANEVRILYYSRARRRQMVADKRLQTFVKGIPTGEQGFLAVRIRRGDDKMRKMLMDLFPSVPMTTFSNDRGDSVVIYALEALGKDKEE